MSDGRQRQRHGATKHLSEGIGGLVVGAAAVLLLRGWLRRRRAAPAHTPSPAVPVDPSSQPASPE